MSSYFNASINSLSNLALSRSWRKHWVYPLLFMLSMLLSLATYLTLDSIQQSVNDYVADNQRALVGGDLILKSKQAWPAGIDKTVNELDGVQSVYDYQFSAMVSKSISPAPSKTTQANNRIDDDNALLTRVKAVTSNYPLYGTVTLASGKPLVQQLQSGKVIVEAQVLSTLNAQIGDTLQLGEANFVIADEILSEPDRPLSVFNFGARVLMRASDLPATELLGQRSRVNYRIELAGNAKFITAAEQTLTALIGENTAITLSDVEQSDTAVSQISDNVLLFLKLLVIAVLFLSAVAQLSVVKAFIAREQSATAIRRALGETMTQIKVSYYRIFIVMALLACAGAMLISFALVQVGAGYLAAVLPANLALGIRLTSIIKVTLIALVITLLIVQHSLTAVTRSKPNAVLKPSVAKPTQTDTQRLQQWGWYALVLLAALALLVWEFASLWMAVKVFGSMLLLTGSFWLLAAGWLRLLHWWVSPTEASKNSNRRTSKSFAVKRSARQIANHWLLRTAVHNLFRKGNQSALFFVTLALSVAVLTMVTLLNHSLTRQFVNAYPDAAPNLFLLDVQQEQHADLNALINPIASTPLTYYPVIRARIRDVNGTPIDQIESGTGDDPTRVFNLSYADTLMDTEYLIASSADKQQNSNSTDPANVLYAPIKAAPNAKRSDNSNLAPALQKGRYGKPVPMSILDTAADMLGVDLGDRIRFNIQGIDVTGQITSIRSRYERGPSPFFYFLFEPSVLQAAPQIQFATAHVSQADIVTIQTTLARRYPAITTVDGGALAKQLQGFVSQMSQLVQIFTFLALLTGIMVLITSLLATSQDRLKDSASFRLLGMQKPDLYAINVLEIGLLGISAGVIAVVGAGIGAWVLVTEWFDLRFAVPWGSIALGLLVLVLVLVGIALVYVRLVIGQGIMARVRGMV